MKHTCLHVRWRPAPVELKGDERRSRRGRHQGARRPHPRPSPTARRRSATASPRCGGQGHHAGAEGRSRVKLTERLDWLEAKGNRPNGTGETRASRAPSRRPSRAYLRQGDRAPEAELKVLTVSSDTQGGYLAPTEMSRRVHPRPRRVLADPHARHGAHHHGAGGELSQAHRHHQREVEGRDAAAGGQRAELRPGGNPDPARSTPSSTSPISCSPIPAARRKPKCGFALAEDFGQEEGLAFVSGNGVLEPGRPAHRRRHRRDAERPRDESLRRPAHRADVCAAGGVPVPAAPG